MDRIGKYLVEGVLGRGAMGVVYKARDPEIDRVVAVKTLRKILPAEISKGGEAIERFITEARSAGRLRHPHIITIFNINLEGETPFIVMDYVEGDTVGAILSKFKRLPVERALDFLRQAAKGLDYAHSQGVLHRDIKPGNLLIDRQNTLYILDFGIASIGETLSKQAGGDDIVMGTPGYMAPEQALNRNVTHKIDIFALGVVAFEMLAGSRPFAGSDFTTAVKAVINERPKSITAVNPAIPVTVESEFERVLSKAPEIRPDTATEFVENLTAAFGKSLGIGAGSEWTHGSPKSSKPPKNAEHAENSVSEALITSAKASKFRKWTVTAAVFCVVMLIVIFTILLIPERSQDDLSGGRPIDAQAVLEAGVDQSIDVSLPELAEVNLSKEPTEMDSQELLALISNGTAEAEKVSDGIDEAVERSIPFLLEGLAKAFEHDSYVVREKVIKVLGDIDDERAGPIILGALDDYDSRVRLAAARAMGKVGSHKTIAYLTIKESREPSAAVKKALKESIESIKSRKR